MRCDSKDHGINLAIPVSGGARAEFFLFANMNGEDCLLSVVVTCSHNENPALCQSLDSSKWPMAREKPCLLMTSYIKTSVTVLSETRVHCTIDGSNSHFVLFN